MPARYGWFKPDGLPTTRSKRHLKSDARALCPSITTRFVDGRQSAILEDAWASAHIFTSLSDNIQETFGLTPVEAMAAGLPVVVSDWDGYRDTVRHGIDGFCVPTLSLAGGQGGDLADRYDAGIDTYDHYCYNASQLVAVDVRAATQAFRQLIENPALRRQMGDAGRERARTKFDWSVVFQSYLALWKELGARRAREATVPMSSERPPHRPDPFSFFSCYPTHTLRDQSRFRRGSPPRTTVDYRNLATIKGSRLLPTANDVTGVLSALTMQWTTYAQLRATCEVPDPALSRTLVWLTKMGAVEYLASIESDLLNRDDGEYPSQL